MNEKPNIAILATEGDHLNMTYNYLKDICEIQSVIVEPHMSRKKMLTYRLKKLGAISVIGQVIFILFTKLLAKLTIKRKKERVAHYQLNLDALPEKQITYVSTVNSKQCRKALKAKPIDFVFVVGTRIIGKKTIDSIPQPFVNIHAGITPKYRGVHGAYWALATGDLENCGVTLHYVDTGVDTGDIIGQRIIEYSKKDNFTTYPIAQAYYGLELLKDNLHSIKVGQNGKKRTDLPSKQWFHPTIWFYLLQWMNKGVN